MSYYDIYRKRLNRYGYDYQTRTQGQRERYFDNLLLKSVYRIDFEYPDADTYNPGIFEPLKQNNTQVLHYLLTKVDVELPSGTILMLQESNLSEEVHPWMVYYKEVIRASSYNRYTMLRLNQEVSWISRKGEKQTILAYFYGQQDNMLRDELKSRSRSDVLYNENLKLSFFVTPTNANIKKDDYFELGEDDLKQGYRITGFDYVSTPGVEFVSVDPVYLRDHSEKPAQQPTDNPDDFFWLNGGDTK